MKEPKPCPICSKPVAVVERLGRGGKQAVYCSLSCRGKADWQRRGHKRRKAKRLANCDHCSKSFETVLDHQRFCSDDCRYTTNSKSSSAKWRAANPAPLNYNYNCDTCGQVVERSLEEGRRSRNAYGRHCESCAVNALSARNRRKNVNRRGITPSQGTVELLRKAAGNNCQLCFEPIDFALPRISRMGATIDHIQPISLGGSDEMSNLQLAHWICNTRKGNKVSEPTNG